MLFLRTEIFSLHQNSLNTFRKFFFYSLIHIFEKDNVKYGHNKKEMKQEKRNRIFFNDLHVPNMWYMCPLRISLFQSQNNRIED